VYLPNGLSQVDECYCDTRQTTLYTEKCLGLDNIPLTLFKFEDCSA